MSRKACMHEFRLYAIEYTVELGDPRSYFYGTYTRSCTKCFKDLKDTKSEWTSEPPEWWGKYEKATTPEQPRES